MQKSAGQLTAARSVSLPRHVVRFCPPHRRSLFKPVLRFLPSTRWTAQTEVPVESPAWFGPSWEPPCCTEAAVHQLALCTWEAWSHLRFPKGPSSGLTSMAIRKVSQRDKEKGCDAFLISINQNTSISRGQTRNSRRHTEIELN